MYNARTKRLQRPDALVRFRRLPMIHECVQRNRRLSEGLRRLEVGKSNLGDCPHRSDFLGEYEGDSRVSLSNWWIQRGYQLERLSRTGRAATAILAGFLGSNVPNPALRAGARSTGTRRRVLKPFLLCSSGGATISAITGSTSWTLHLFLVTARHFGANAMVPESESQHRTIPLCPSLVDPLRVVAHEWPFSFAGAASAL
jgi:hypothetical protein